MDAERGARAVERPADAAMAVRVCTAPGCRALAVLGRDDLSYAADRLVWACTEGHWVVEPSGTLLAQARSVGSQAVEQLESALSTRVLIEQAEGVLAATSGTGLGDADRAMRDRALALDVPLAAIAARVVDRTLDLRVDAAPDDPAPDDAAPDDAAPDDAAPDDAA